jgi:hypothetical protein
MPNYNFAALEEFLCESCNFIGPISPRLATFGPLTVLNLAFNALTGAISDDLSNLETLVELYLNNNQLNGTIPTLGGLLNLSTSQRWLLEMR